MDPVFPGVFGVDVIVYLVTRAVFAVLVGIGEVFELPLLLVLLDLMLGGRVLAGQVGFEGPEAAANQSGGSCCDDERFGGFHR
jgi:hypothetical protein